MNDWKEYIEQTFRPESDIKIEDGMNDFKNGINRIIHNLTGTIFDFSNPNEDWKKNSDVQFYNPKTKGWPVEFWKSDYYESEKKKIEPIN